MKTLRSLFILLFLTLALGTMRAQSKMPTPTPTLSVNIDTFATAIAKAEGFGQRGTIPTRYHNPGDIKSVYGEKFFGQVRVGKGGHIVFRNDAAGWLALRAQIERMICGQSHFYTPEMSLQQIAKRYAGNYRVWARNVSRNLGCPPSITLAELFDIPPTPPTVTPVLDLRVLEAICCASI